MTNSPDFEVGIDLCKRRNTTLTVLISIYCSRNASVSREATEATDSRKREEEITECL